MFECFSTYSSMTGHEIMMKLPLKQKVTACLLSNRGYCVHAVSPCWSERLWCLFPWCLLANLKISYITPWSLTLAAKQTNSSVSLLQAGEDFAGYKIGTNVMSFHKEEKGSSMFFSFRSFLLGSLSSCPTGQSRHQQCWAILSAPKLQQNVEMFPKKSIAEFRMETGI